ncbi:glycosyltransferase, partial [Arsenophonus sp.]
QPTITLYKINIPLEKYRYRYNHHCLDKEVELFINNIKPEVVHIGHLNHLSTSWVDIIAKKNIPIIYTLHDYWLMCPRGQFIQRSPTINSSIWPLCNKQNNKKCATQCYSGYFSGHKIENNMDIAYWTNWVKRRMNTMYQITKKITYFIAPSLYLYHRYINNFRIPSHKMIYLDYGFDLDRLNGRQRLDEEDFTFGYIGTHIPAKGIQILIKAFARLENKCKLRIWGKHRHQNTPGLKLLASKLPSKIQSRIEWLSEYPNETIVKTVFNHVDCIVVPSIWVENSPLVIHEALQARIPVITANIGGMSEYVHHEINGLLFKHRNEKSLSEQMQRLVNDPLWAKKLGLRGYIQSKNGDVPSQKVHVTEIEKIYRSLL